MNAIISVTGKDSVGIIAKVANVCTEYGANILDVSQTVMRDYFAMIMLVDTSKLKVMYDEFSDTLAALGESNGLRIHTMHEEIFNSMHRI